MFNRKTQLNAGFTGVLILGVAMVATLLAVSASSYKTLNNYIRVSTGVQDTKAILLQTKSMLVRKAQSIDSSFKSVKVVDTQTAWANGVPPLTANEASILPTGCSKPPVGRQFDAWGTPLCLMAFTPKRTFLTSLLPSAAQVGALDDTDLNYYTESGYTHPINDINVEGNLAHWPAFVLISAGSDRTFDHASANDYNKDLALPGTNIQKKLNPKGNDILVYVDFEDLSISNNSTRLEMVTALEQCNTNEVLSYINDPNDPSKNKFVCKTAPTYITCPGGYDEAAALPDDTCKRIMENHNSIIRDVANTFKDPATHQYNGPIPAYVPMACLDVADKKDYQEGEAWVITDEYATTNNFALAYWGTGQFISVDTNPGDANKPNQWYMVPKFIRVKAYATFPEGDPKRLIGEGSSKSCEAVLLVNTGIPLP